MGKEDCLKLGIMVDFIHAYGTEVINMLFTEFNLEDALEVRGEERYEDGFEDGLIKGREWEIRLIRRKLAAGMIVSDIAAWLELEPDYITQVQELCRQNPNDTDQEITARIVKQ